jgi:FkbM family methyltransferase
MDFAAEFRSKMPVLKIVDVGAMSLGQGSEPYAPLLRAFRCEVIGFEPVAVECDRLNALKQAGQTYLPYFIGDGGKHTFYECKSTATSSLFEPNTPLLEKFQNLANLVSVVSTSEVETKRLDDIPEAIGTDYLKIDVQGAELLVLQGATVVLETAALVHLEVEFVELYKHQPLFADIDAAMRARGFVFHRFAHTMGRTFKPLLLNNNINQTMSQTLWGDAVYVRDFMSFDRLAPPTLLKLAAILHENYRSFDLASLALKAYDDQTGSKVFAAYLQFVVNATKSNRAPA